MKKKIIAAIAIAVLIAAGLWYGFSGKKGAPQFKTMTVTKGAIRATVTATGTVNPVVTVNVGTQVSGTIKYTYATYNSVVKKGQIIAQIDPATFKAQVDQARANLIQAEATLTSLKANLVNAKRTRDRNKELISKELIAQADYDNAETAFLSQDALVKAQQGQVAQMKGALDFAETNLRYTSILSPVDGIVVSRNVDVGQTVAASFQTPTLFYIARDLTRMQIDTNVDEADIGRVKTDQEVDFTVDAYPDILFKGKVSQIRIAPITVQNVVTYDVVIQMENKDLKLKPGMTANVSIVTAVKDDILRLPNAALRFRPQEREREKEREAKPAAQGAAPRRGQAVWVLDKGKPKRVQVKTGISDGTNTEILSGDLADGQPVITESLTRVKNSDTPSFMPKVRR